MDGSAFGGIMAWDCLPFEDKGLFHRTKQWEAQQAYQPVVEVPFSLERHLAGMQIQWVTRAIRPIRDFCHRLLALSISRGAQRRRLHAVVRPCYSISRNQSFTVSRSRSISSSASGQQ